MPGLVPGIHDLLASKNVWRRVMTLEYAVHIVKLPENEGGGYVASVPDLPGCMSDGTTPEEALHNVQEAIESWQLAASEWGDAEVSPADFAKQAAMALERLPVALQQRAVAYLLEQGEKFIVLKKLLDDGEADIKAGRVHDWDYDDFMRRARLGSGDGN
jgi:antitoxin HicB